MAFTQADAQNMMHAFLPVIHQLIQENNKLIIDAMQTKDEKGRIGSRSIGGPPEWDSSNESSFQEWQIKIQAWLTNQDSRALQWLDTAGTLNEVIETNDLDEQQYPNENERKAVLKFNTLLYNILVTKLKGEAFNLVSSVRDGSGLEAWRLLMKRYAPRTPATKRALLKSIFNMKAAKKVEEIEKNLLKLEEIYSKYETMSKNLLPEDIKTVIMVELCTPELREHLEFNAKDNDYKETREAVMAYVERKRRDPITAMEIGNNEGETQEHSGDWWSGTYDYGWVNDDSNEHEINYSGYVAKGKGGVIMQKGKGKGNGAAKGGGKFDGYTKGGGKDKGKGKTGKAGVFQGSCHWCGQWGHTANKCQEKDAYMDWVRNQRGNGTAHNNQKVAYQLEASNDQDDGWKTVGGDLGALEGPARFVDVCNLNKNEVVLQNRFHVLSDTEEDEQQNLESASSIGQVVKRAKRRWEINHLG